VTARTGDPNAPLEIGASCDVYTYGIFECDETGTKILRCESGHWVLQSDCAEDGRVCRENDQTTSCGELADDTEADDEGESEGENDADQKDEDVSDGDSTDTVKPDTDTVPDKTIAPGKDCSWLLEQLGESEAYACYGEQALYCGEWEGSRWRTWGDDCADDGMYCHVSVDYGDVYCASYPADTDPFADVDWMQSDTESESQPDAQDGADVDDAGVSDEDIFIDIPATEQWGTAAEDAAFSLVVDGGGNIFVTGRSAGPLDGNANAGYEDVFLTKWSNDGTKVWTRQWGSSSTDVGLSIAADASGNIFVTGLTSGSLDGNTNSGGTCTEGGSTVQCPDVFLTKWNGDGTKAWTKQWGTTAGDYGRGVASDADGNIYVTGYTGGSLDGNVSSGGSDIFLTKWNNDGIKAWTRQWGSSLSDYGFSVAVAPNGDVVVTGSTTGTFPGCVKVGASDLILTRWNGDGTNASTRQWGTTGNDYGRSVKVAAAGDIYLTGGTSGAFEGNTSAGDEDVFLVRLNTDGSPAWTRQWGTSAKDLSSSCAIDTNGAVFVVGYTQGQLDGGPSAGIEDAFLTKWAGDGTKAWTRQWGTSSKDYGTSVAAIEEGTILVTGYTEGALGDTANAGGFDIFLSIIEDQ